MAAMDFMHKQLINAASKDALGSIGMGAGIGAGVGAANALITGNDSLLGGATSGAMLGAAGGAGMRYAGTKYGAGMADIIGDGARKDTGKFATSTFSRPEAKPFNFWKNSDADNAAMAKVRANVVEPGSGTGAAGAQNPVAAPVVSPSTNMLPKGTDLKAHQASKMQTKQAMKNADEYTAYQNSLAKAEMANPSLANQRTTGELQSAQNAQNMSNAVKNATGPVAPRVSAGSNVMTSGSNTQAPLAMSPKKPALNALSNSMNKVNQPSNNTVGFPLGSEYKSPLDIAVPKVSGMPDFKAMPKPKLKMGSDGYYA